MIENTLIKTQPILKVHNLGITLHRDGLPIQLLIGVGFTLESGSTLGILGESGCGKSLLAKALVSIFPPESTVMGEILFCPGDKE
ncbi:MAG: ATP-binding cassette domain-containing protein, partial [Nitrosopumilus sp.]